MSCEGKACVVLTNMYGLTIVSIVEIVGHTLTTVVLAAADVLVFK